jgi:hypothetical protein
MLASSNVHSDGPASAQLERRNWLNLAAYILNSVITYTSLTGIFGETNATLSDKYQTLVTPSGWAFSIWGPIFIWEGVFAVAQMLPRFRGSQVVQAVSPWWWGACLAQCGWTLAFAQEVIPLSLLFMLTILGCLLGASANTDGLEMSWAEYLCLRAPFSMHLGWIVVASALNTNVQFDAAKASPQSLLAVAVNSFVGVGMLNAVLATTTKSPDMIANFVAAWAFLAISSELSDGAKLADPSRYNPYEWPALVRQGLGAAATVASFGMLALALASAARAARRGCLRKQCGAAEDQLNSV